MSEDFGEARRNITVFLSSLRHSIDRHSNFRSRSGSMDRDRFMRIMLMIEEARLRLNVYSRYTEGPTRDEWAEARSELIKFVDNFVHSRELDGVIFDKRFMLGPIMSRDRDNPTPFIRNFTSESDKPLTIGNALVHFRNYLQNSAIEVTQEQDSLPFGELDRIVPRQQVAPVQFDILDGRIVTAKRPPRIEDKDRSNIGSALDHIRESGVTLVTNLEKSNCDRRLIESAKELQSQLISGGNVVRIGLANMACGIMSMQFQSELPDAIVGMMNAYNSSISLYVSQFPEWEQFTLKASAVNLNDDDIAEVDTAAREVINVLAGDPTLADDDVPKTIAAVRQFLAVPGSSSKRAAFAMIRTLENLVSSIVRYSVAFMNKTVEKTVDGASTAASKIITGLLGVALVSATGIGPAAVRTGAPWVKQAAEIVEKQIEKMAE